jgi:hypothetical protein
VFSSSFENIELDLNQRFLNKLEVWSAIHNAKVLKSRDLELDDPSAIASYDAYVFDQDAFLNKSDQIWILANKNIENYQYHWNIIFKAAEAIAQAMPQKCDTKWMALETFILHYCDYLHIESENVVVTFINLFASRDSFQLQRMSTKAVQEYLIKMHNQGLDDYLPTLTQLIANTNSQHSVNDLLKDGPKVCENLINQGFEKYLNLYFKFWTHSKNNGEKFNPFLAENLNQLKLLEEIYSKTSNVVNFLNSFIEQNQNINSWNHQLKDLCMICKQIIESAPSSCDKILQVAIDLNNQKVDGSLYLSELVKAKKIEAQFFSIEHDRYLKYITELANLSDGMANAFVKNGRSILSLSEHYSTKILEAGIELAKYFGSAPDDFFTFATKVVRKNPAQLQDWIKSVHEFGEIKPSKLNYFINITSNSVITNQLELHKNILCRTVRLFENTHRSQKEKGRTQHHDEFATRAKTDDAELLLFKYLDSLKYDLKYQIKIEQYVNSLVQAYYKNQLKSFCRIDSLAKSKITIKYFYDYLPQIEMIGLTDPALISKSLACGQDKRTAILKLSHSKISENLISSGLYRRTETRVNLINDISKLIKIELKNSDFDKELKKLMSVELIVLRGLARELNSDDLCSHLKLIKLIDLFANQSKLKKDYPLNQVYGTVRLIDSEQKLIVKTERGDIFDLLLNCETNVLPNLTLMNRLLDEECGNLKIIMKQGVVDMEIGNISFLICEDNETYEKVLYVNEIKLNKLIWTNESIKWERLIRNSLKRFASDQSISSIYFYHSQSTGAYNNFTQYLNTQPVNVTLVRNSRERQLDEFFNIDDFYTGDLEINENLEKEFIENRAANYKINVTGMKELPNYYPDGEFIIRNLFMPENIKVYKIDV